MLTNKCKIEFEKFLLTYNSSKETEFVGYYEILHFFKLPFSMQYGVYVDFFEQNNILLDIQPTVEKPPIFSANIIYQNKVFIKVNDNITREQARKGNVLRANKLYNNQ